MATCTSVCINQTAIECGSPSTTLPTCSTNLNTDVTDLFVAMGSGQVITAANTNTMFQAARDIGLDRNYSTTAIDGLSVSLGAVISGGVYSTLLSWAKSLNVAYFPTVNFGTGNLIYSGDMSILLQALSTISTSCNCVEDCYVVSLGADYCVCNY